MLNKYDEFQGLSKFSKHIGFSESKLVEAYKIEAKYHNLILNAQDKNERKILYNLLYKEVHQIYYSDKLTTDISKLPFARKAILYKKELENKSILEVGCGRGAFIISASKSYYLKKITGLDVSLPSMDIIEAFPNIEFIETDITEFNLIDKYDIIYSNHVLEHMAPLDIDSHIRSLKNALNPGGKIIINMPNKLFGPSDVTRIKDFTYTNAIPAEGSHFFESTYDEVIERFKNHGFDIFYSPIPHTILRHILPFIRIKSSLIAKLERKESIIKFLHKIKINGRCRLNYEISIIASMSNS
jgi:2-polyprenyl-3-methyl-5-hydroxy-6-metoxy-1,4-benzoquinol methylase